MPLYNDRQHLNTGAGGYFFASITRQDRIAL